MKQFWNWKKILAFSLAATLTLTGGLFAWQWNNWFGRAGEEPPSAAMEYPRPDPIRFAPHDPNPPPVQNYGPDPADFRLDEATGEEYVKGIAVVMFERGATEAQQQAALAASGGEIVGRADMVGKWQLRVPEEDYASLLALCGRLKAMPGVVAAMPDHVTKAVLQAPPSADPWTGRDNILNTNLNNVDGNALWAVTDRLPEAWKVFDGLAAQQVKLGMVDAGVSTSHDELSGIVQNVTTINGFNPPPYSYTVTPHGHAMGVAGIMAARANNNKGGAGVAWDAKVYAIDGVSAGGTEQVYYDSILAVVREGVNAVNFSLGIIDNNAGLSLAGQERHGKLAARNLLSMLSWGWTDFVIVQSAGNYNTNSIGNGYFASVTAEHAESEGLTEQEIAMVMNRILVAGSLEPNAGGYRQTYFSAHSGVNQVFAPGSLAFTANTGGDNSYQQFTGTSGSAPQLTATAGWMLALNPALDGGQAGALLKMEAVSPRDVRPYGGGAAVWRKLDCMRALAVAAARLESLQTGVEVSQAGQYIILSDKTAAAALLASLKPVNGSLVYDKAQTPQLAGTGDQIKLKTLGDADLEILYTLVVKGDLNGDGRVDALDAQCLLGLEEGTWQLPYGEDIFDLALDGMSAQELFDRGME